MLRVSSTTVNARMGLEGGERHRADPLAEDRAGRRMSCQADDHAKAQSSVGKRHCYCVKSGAGNARNGLALMVSRWARASSKAVRPPAHIRRETPLRARQPFPVTRGILHTRCVGVARLLKAIYAPRDSFCGLGLQQRSVRATGAGERSAYHLHMTCSTLPELPESAPPVS
jgi:hypothetical protein